MNLALSEFVANHPDEFAEYKVISVFVHAGHLIHSKKPVRTSDDLRGLKIRIPGRTTGWMVEAMGSTPIGAPISKIPEMLSKGIVDAVLIPFEVMAPLKVHELVDYHIILDDDHTGRLNTQVFVTAMNLESYNALPSDLQAVIDRNADEATARWVGQVWTDSEKPGAELAAQSGEIISLPADEVAILEARLARPVADRWVEVVGRRGSTVFR